MIAVYCFYFDTIGFGRHARGFVDALAALEEIALLPWDDPPPGFVPTPSQRAMLERGSRYRGDGVAIGLGPIERLDSIRGSWRIGFAVWETTLLPPDKLQTLRALDEVWTASHWGRDLFLANGLAPDAVRVVPEGVDTSAFQPAAEPPSTPPFRFLSVGKWEARKAFDILIHAFSSEFAPEEPVELVLHCFNPFVPGVDWEAVVRAAAAPPHAPIVYSPRKPDAAMRALYHSSHAFVLPTRAEGWGLPVMEAMACGLPVIVTHYSAPAEYLEPSIAYPIQVDSIVPVHDPLFYPSGGSFGCWAEPDLADLRRAMRHVFSHPQEAREKGRLARARVETSWTWSRAAAVAQSFLRTGVQS